MNLVPLYKGVPPFMDFKDGYGFLGVVLLDEDSGRIQCHLCGGLFRSISKHLWHKHDTTPEEYRTAVGLNSTTPLICPSTSDKLRAEYLEHQTVVDARLRRLSKKQYGVRSGNLRRRKASAQEKNLFGTCDEQIKARFLEHRERFGRVPTSSEVPHGFYTLVNDRYGSWIGALRAFGLDEKEIAAFEKDKLDRTRPIRIATVQKNNRKRWGEFYTRDRVLSLLRTFKKENGRAPTWGECRGFLPTRDTIRTVLNVRTKPELLALL